MPIVHRRHSLKFNASEGDVVQQAKSAELNNISVYSSLSNLIEKRVQKMPKTVAAEAELCHGAPWQEVLSVTKCSGK